MIVACTSCGTRFRVADGKIGPRGARIHCARCGTFFQVAGPRPEPIAAEVPPAPEPVPVAADAPPSGEAHLPPHSDVLAAPEPPGAHPPSTEPTGTGGWPTGVLEVAAGAPAEPGSNTGLSLAADPFAAFAAQEPGPPPAPQAPPFPEPSLSDDRFLDGLPVTDLSALERTGAVPVPPSPPPGSAPEPDVQLEVDDGLSLEERAPAPTPGREGAGRWSEPEASRPIEVGPDGFQEVDLARAEVPADPGFETVEDGPTRQVGAVLPATPPAGATDQPVAGGGAVPADDPAVATIPESTDLVASPRRIDPARARALTMNVVSLAALLVVTLGIVLWWRGDGLGSLLRWPRGGHADLELGDLRGAVYEGTPGNSLVVVRGTLRATHEPIAGPVAVRVVLERAGVPIAAATAVAGAVPSVEDLATARTAGDLDHLRGRLAPGATPRIVPGTDVPFLAVLPVPDGDLATVRFRAEPVPSPGR